jgi:hypothetical protein
VALKLFQRDVVELELLQMKNGTPSGCGWVDSVADDVVLLTVPELTCQVQVMESGVPGVTAIVSVIVSFTARFGLTVAVAIWVCVPLTICNNWIVWFVALVKLNPR